jgi:hypothetical protein
MNGFHASILMGFAAFPNSTLNFGKNRLPAARASIQLFAESASWIETPPEDSSKIIAGYSSNGGSQWKRIPASDEKMMDHSDLSASAGDSEFVFAEDAAPNACAG